MRIVLITIVAGLLGATGRIIFLELISRTKLVHYDMIEAVGTHYHGSFDHALLRGLVPIIFSACYLLLFILS